MAPLYYEILDSHVLLFSLTVLLFSLYSLSRRKKKNTTATLYSDILDFHMRNCPPIPPLSQH